MKNKMFATDERMTALTGRIAVIFLALTQTALLALILFRRFVLDQGQEHYNDIRLVLLLSVFGYIATRVYFGAVLPVLSIKTLFIIYLGLVVILFVTLSIWLGLPDLQNWRNTLLPIGAGPALLVTGYGLFAYFGRKRIEKEIFSEEESK